MHHRAIAGADLDGRRHARQHRQRLVVLAAQAGVLPELLRGGLDLQSGGSLARDLSDLYAYLSLRLTQANLHNDPERLEEVKRLVQPLRDAWNAIGSQVDQRNDA